MTSSGMRRGLIIAILMTTTHWLSNACSCIAIHSFCEAVLRAQGWDPDRNLVAMGRIVDEIVVGPFRTDKVLMITKSYYNPLEVKVIRIIDGNGADCGRSMDDYLIGDEVVFETVVVSDSIHRCSFSICSPAPLRIKGNRVIGHITKSEEQVMSLTRFENLADCLGNAVPIILYPNPATIEVRISRKALVNQSDFESVVVIDALGRTVYDKKLSPDERMMTHLSIQVRDWPKGVYFVRVHLQEQYFVKPLLVNNA